MVLFLFLAHLGVGIVFTLVFVSREAGVKFFRFNAGLAAILLAVAFAFRPPSVGDAAGRAARARRSSSPRRPCVLYWATIGRALASIRPAIVGVGVRRRARRARRCRRSTASAARASPAQALTVASFLSSAALLGGACTAMILGHWYLVIPSMQVSHLQSIVKVHIASMVVAGRRGGRGGVRGDRDVAARARARASATTSCRSSGIFFWQRVLFGLAGPALLSYLTWETAKIRSTQSATGILYVDFFTVVVGEVLAKYLLLATRVPV